MTPSLTRRAVRAPVTVRGIGPAASARCASTRCASDGGRPRRRRAPRPGATRRRGRCDRSPGQRYSFWPPDVPDVEAGHLRPRAARPHARVAPRAPGSTRGSRRFLRGISRSVPGSRATDRPASAGADLARVALRPSHVERVVAALDREQRRAIAQLREDAGQQFGRRERIARALHEDHRNLDAGRGARRGSARACRAGAADSRGRPDRPRASAVGHGHRGDPAAERLPARPDRLPLRSSGGRRERGPPRLLQERRRVGRLPSVLDVREVEAQRRDTLVVHRARESRHERVVHARAGAVRQHQRRDGDPRAGRTRPRPVPGPRRSSVVPRGLPRVSSCHRERQPLSRHVGVRLRRVEARRLLPRGTEEPRDARRTTPRSSRRSRSTTRSAGSRRRSRSRRGASRRSRGSCSR